MNNFDFSYPRYLRAKESVDKRALNDRVRRRFFRELSQSGNAPRRILEVGGGTGATLRRVLSRAEQVPSLQSVRYTFVEKRAENVQAAKRDLRAWALETGYDWSLEADRAFLRGRPSREEGPRKFTVDFVVDDFFDYTARQDGPEYDAVVAQALFDLVDVGAALRTLQTVLRPGGVWYLPIHFDGVTGFEPSLDGDLDRTIERLYHRSMQDPKTGRHLLSTLRETGSTLLEVGASDWIVFGTDREYVGDEAYFLRCILYFVTNELNNHDELGTASLSSWTEKRQTQIDDGTLIYLAHQIDICAKNNG